MDVHGIGPAPSVSGDGQKKIDEEINNINNLRKQPVTPENIDELIKLLDNFKNNNPQNVEAFKKFQKKFNNDPDNMLNSLYKQKVRMMDISVISAGLEKELGPKERAEQTLLLTMKKFETCNPNEMNEEDVRAELANDKAKIGDYIFWKNKDGELCLSRKMSGIGDKPFSILTQRFTPIYASLKNIVGGQGKDLTTYLNK